MEVSNSAICADWVLWPEYFISVELCENLRGLVGNKYNRLNSNSSLKRTIKELWTKQ